MRPYSLRFTPHVHILNQMLQSELHVVSPYLLHPLPVEPPKYINNGKMLHNVGTAQYNNLCLIEYFQGHKIGYNKCAFIPGMV